METSVNIEKTQMCNSANNEETPLKMVTGPTDGNSNF